MAKYFKVSLLLLPLLFFSVSGTAQKTPVHLSVVNKYQDAVDLFDKEQYGAAREMFADIIKNSTEGRVLMKINSEYYHALCAARLFNDDAEYLINQFIQQYPESQRITHVQFEMADYHYRNDSFNLAIKWFDTIDVPSLYEEEQFEYYFKLGYAYFKTEHFDEARVAFFEIMDKDTKYASPATYYYAHIAYEQKNYQTALNGFKKLTDDATFSPVAPYYIIQILYLQHEFDEIIDFTVPLIDSVELRRKDEIFRILGEAYYNTEQYDTAIIYLHKYIEETDEITYDDKYHLAYAFYRVGRHEEAASLFKEVANQENKMSQNALYHLGDCYIKLGQKREARLAFSSASSMDYDSVIKREAMFNYAQVTFDISYSPFNDAIKALNKYIEMYPGSDNTNKAYKYLVMAYLNTRNYKDAFASLQQLDAITDDELKKAYQRIAYFRGLELYNNLEFKEAIDLFDKSLQYASFNRDIKVKAYYWKAEALYRLKNYTDAIENYKTYINSLGAFRMNYYNEAHYGTGYAYFKLEKYEPASTFFRKYVNLMEQETKKTGDAYNRIGDCFFMNREYWRAVDFYTKAIQVNLIDQDYAQFQKGFSYGLMNKYEEKVNVLNQMLQYHPNSAYYDDALYEGGKAYVELNNLDSAISRFTQLVNKYPQSNYAAETFVKLGLIYYNKDENKKALAYYKKVIENYPKNKETENALTGIQNIYLDMSNADAYFEYVENLEGFEPVSDERKDSMKYSAAENVYMKGQCNRAIPLFNDYLNEFEHGNFLLNAHYYKGSCHFRNKEYMKALEAFEYIISQKQNFFTKDALLKAARIHYQNNNYNKALANYQKLEDIADEKSVVLESRIYIMRCYVRLNNHEKTIEAVEKLLNTDKVTQSVVREARFKKAMAFYHKEKWDEAIDAFTLIVHDVKSNEGAEAKFRIAEIYYKKRELKEARKVILDFSDKNTPHQYWLAKSFLLLADIYAEEDNEFQAIHTLKSIIKNYDTKDDGIIETAQRKKEQLVEQQENEEGL